MTELQRQPELQMRKASSAWEGTVTPGSGYAAAKPELQKYRYLGKLAQVKQLLSTLGKRGVARALFTSPSSTTHVTPSFATSTTWAFNIVAQQTQAQDLPTFCHLSSQYLFVQRFFSTAIPAIMPPPRGQKRKSTATTTDDYAPETATQKIATKGEDEIHESPTKKRKVGAGLTLAKKQALIDNLQLEGTFLWPDAVCPVNS